jgi:hypothetical protein
MDTGDPDYVDLARRHPPDLVRQLEIQLGDGGSVEITADRLAAATRQTKAAALKLLVEAASRGWLVQETRRTCSHCGSLLTPEDIASGLCPLDPQIAFGENGVRVLEQEVFRRDRPRTRDVQWILTLHGMNTRGTWQEAFNWLVSRSYGRMVPVAIYKYGIVRPGAFVGFLQQRHLNHLIARLQELTQEAAGGGFGSPPDVIAHSFGTWLLGHVLRNEKLDLKVGRVILAGSVLRPDFPWKRLIDAGQVEAVLNHFGTRDNVARIAHYFVRDSGPSGRKGFDDPGAINVEASGFTHSQFFQKEEMIRLFRNGKPKGLWHEFLTLPQSALPQLDTAPRPGWKQSFWRRR